LRAALSKLTTPAFRRCVGSEFAELAVWPLIDPHGAEFRTAEYGHFPLGYLDPLHTAGNAHGVLPHAPVTGGEASNPAASPEESFLAASQSLDHHSFNVPDGTIRPVQR